MDFEQLQKANQTLKLTPIERKDKFGKRHTKNYVEVNQRIKAFRMLFPEGFITTEIVKLDYLEGDRICVMKAEVGYTDSEGLHILATGTAYEKESSSFINQTSFIENCETSAVGRALGMVGIGIDTSVASYEEVGNAMQQQADKEPLTDIHIRALENRCLEDGVDTNLIFELYKVNSIDGLTMRQYANINDNWNKIVERSKQ